MKMTFTKEQKNQIYEEYGSTYQNINNVIEILNCLELPFLDEQDYLYTLYEIVELLQTRKEFREQGYTIKDAIIKVIRERFEEDINYNEILPEKIEDIAYSLNKKI